MAQFVYKPWEPLVCPECGIHISLQERMNSHIERMHPEAWGEWLGYLRDIKELDGIYSLKDKR
jgi:Zn-finger nucleic acid-binding protein